MFDLAQRMNIRRAFDHQQKAQDCAAKARSYRDNPQEGNCEYYQLASEGHYYAARVYMGLKDHHQNYS